MLTACFALAAQSTLQAAPSPASEPVYLTQPWFHPSPNVNVLMQVMKKREVQVDDLYALLKPRQSEFQKDDNVHFSQAASGLMGKQVTDCILKNLGGEKYIRFQIQTLTP